MFILISVTIIRLNIYKHVESFKYLGGILTSDGRCNCEIKCRIAMAKADLTRRGIFLLAHWTWN
jgi:hypothetical protein